jgi:DNA polymerase-3 subunit beta
MIPIHKDHLLIACKHLQRAVNTRHTLPSLACVHIEPGLHETRFTSANLEQAVAASVPTSGSKLSALRAKNAGSFLVDAGVLANAAASADAATFLQLDRDSIQLTIGSQVSTIPITTESAAEFPPLPEVDWMPVSGQIDLDALKRLMRCASTDETRYILNSVYWDKEGLLVATDGRRLHTEPFAPLEVEGVTIPYAACRMIPPRASISLERPKDQESPEEPVVHLPSRYIAFVATENILTIRIFSKLLDGKFPSWRQVMPQPTSHSVRFNNQDAAANLRKINKLVAGRKKELGSTLLEPSPGRITFHLRKDEVTIGSFTQPAVLTGNPEKIAFNTQFLIDALENGGDTFSYLDGMHPARITGVKQNTHILMPVRVTPPPAAVSEPEPEEDEVDEEQYYTAHEP